MLGLIRKTIEKFDLNKYPHKYPKEMTTLISEDDIKGDKYKRELKESGHLKRYYDINKGYFTLYDLAVYIIVGTFMLAFLYLICKEIQQKEKAYMFICLTIIGICALLY